MIEITTKQGKDAFEVHQDILILKKQMGMAFVELGRLLKKIRDEEYYQVLGYDTFTSYVINSDLGFKRRTAYYYIEIYEWFVEKLGYKVQAVAKIGYDKLTKLLPIIKKEYDEANGDKLISSSVLKERVSELVLEAKELRPVDFEKKYKDDRINEGQEEYLAPPEYFRCDKCKKWIIVVPKEDCCKEWLKKFRSKK